MKTLALLLEQQQMEEQMRQMLTTVQGDFQEKLLEEREKNQREGERLRRELEERDNSLLSPRSVSLVRPELSNGPLSTFPEHFIKNCP